MPDPSTNWTDIQSQVGIDKPLPASFFQNVRDDLQFLKEWLGFGYTGAQNHNHNGVNSARIADSDLIKTMTVSKFDDFLDGNLHGWSKTAGGSSTVISAANGVCEVTNNSVNYDGIYLSGRPFQIAGTSTLIIYEARVMKIGNITNFRWGLVDALTGGTEGCYFDRLAGAPGNFQCVTKKAGTASTFDTGVATTASTWFVLRIEWTSASVKFYIDGVLKRTETTNIPVTNLTPAFAHYDPGAGLTADVDYINCYSNGRI